MPAKRRVIEQLFELKSQAKRENKQYVSDIISLYKAREIKQPAVAMRIARKLAGTRAQVPGGLALLESYKERIPATGKLARQVAGRRIGPLKVKDYWVKGTVHTHEYFYKKTQVKGQRGTRHHKDYNMNYHLPEKIKATTPAEAKRKYKEQMETTLTLITMSTSLRPPR